MRFNYKVFFIGILSLILTDGAKANSDTLTIGQAFNWQVGDTLIYESYQWKEPNTTGQPLIYTYSVQIGFSVQSKINRNDSVIYSLLYFDGFNASVGFTNLDSPMYRLLNLNQFPFFCHFLDSLPTCDSSWANCTSTAFNDSSFFNRLTLYQTYHVYTTGYFYYATQNIGIRQAEFNSEEFFPNAPFLTNGGCGAVLVYYHSGNTYWADSALLFPATGINDLSFDSKGFSIYPNPSSNVVRIEKTEPTSADASEIKIYDLQGRVIYIKTISGSWNKQEIDVSAFEAGVYLLMLTDNKTHAIYRNRIVRQ